jgi:uncharacterized protein YjbI with pentapeptide repeats
LPYCEYKYEPFYAPTIKFACNEPSITNGKFCIFHDKDHYAEYEQEVTKRFEEIVSESISQNKPLECFGYYLPAINFRKLLKEKTFVQPVYFNEARFSQEAHFSEARFSKRANFYVATFSEQAYFYEARFSQEANFYVATFSQEANFYVATFSQEVYFISATFSERVDFSATTFSQEANFSYTKFLAESKFLKAVFTNETFFNYTLFEQPNKVIFDDSDLSKVSFADSDITRIKFGDKITWGGKDRFTIIEEEWLKAKSQEKNEIDDTKGIKEKHESLELVLSVKGVSLELVLSVYRNLRENYEFRLRYDDAGKFFIKEMELKRRYRENGLQIRENGWLRRHFSLTGLYYHLSRYGESISRPTLIAAITVFLSTLFWVTQSNPSLEPHISSFLGQNPSALADSNLTASTFVGFSKAGEPGQWLKAFERSFADFLPLLSLGGEIKVGIIDYIIKIFGGALTFGLLLIAFRRKFERKYTR